MSAQVFGQSNWSVAIHFKSRLLDSDRARHPYGMRRAIERITTGDIDPHAPRRVSKVSGVPDAVRNARANATGAGGGGVDGGRRVSNRTTSPAWMVAVLGEKPKLAVAISTVSIVTATLSGHGMTCARGPASDPASEPAEPPRPEAPAEPALPAAPPLPEVPAAPPVPAVPAAPPVPEDPPLPAPPPRPPVPAPPPRPAPPASSSSSPHAARFRAAMQPSARARVKSFRLSCLLCVASLKQDW